MELGVRLTGGERRADRGHHDVKGHDLVFKKHTLCQIEVSFWGSNNGPSSGSALQFLFTSRSPKTEPIFMSSSMKNQSPCGNGFVSSLLRYHGTDKFYCSTWRDKHPVLVRHPCLCSLQDVLTNTPSSGGAHSSHQVNAHHLLVSSVLSCIVFNCLNGHLCCAGCVAFIA